MNIRSDKDLVIRFDSITRKLKESGADLSRIRIAMERNSVPSYITKRIMEDIKEEMP